SRTTRKAGDLAFLDVTGRVAGTLLELCREPDAMTHPDGMQIKITRQEIGRIVGCSREMVGRVLKELEEQGLVSVKGKTMVVYGTRPTAPARLSTGRVGQPSCHAPLWGRLVFHTERWSRLCLMIFCLPMMTCPVSNPPPPRPRSGVFWLRMMNPTFTASPVWCWRAFSLMAGGWNC